MDHVSTGYRDPCAVQTVSDFRHKRPNSGRKEMVSGSHEVAVI